MTTTSVLPRRLAFAAAFTTLTGCLFIMTAAAVETDVAPAPDTDAIVAEGGEEYETEDSPVVDRLNSWGETDGKGDSSPAKGGDNPPKSKGKNKNRAKDKNKSKSKSK